MTKLQMGGVMSQKLKCLDCGNKFESQEAERTEYYDLALCPDCGSGYVKVTEKPTNPYTIALMQIMKEAKANG